MPSSGSQCPGPGGREGLKSSPGSTHDSAPWPGAVSPGGRTSLSNLPRSPMCASSGSTLVPGPIKEHPQEGTGGSQRGHGRVGRSGWVVPGEQPPQRPRGSMVSMIATGEQTVCRGVGRGESNGAYRRRSKWDRTCNPEQCLWLLWPLNWRSQEDQGSRKDMGCLSGVAEGA